MPARRWRRGSSAAWSRAPGSRRRRSGSRAAWRASTRPRSRPYVAPCAARTTSRSRPASPLSGDSRSRYKAGRERGQLPLHPGGHRARAGGTGVRGSPLHLRRDVGARPPAGVRPCESWRGARHASRRAARELSPLRRGVLRDRAPGRGFHPAQLPRQAARAGAHARYRGAARPARGRALPRAGRVGEVEAPGPDRLRPAGARLRGLRGADRGLRRARGGGRGRGRRHRDPHVHERDDGASQGRHADAPRLHRLRDGQRRAGRRPAARRGPPVRAALPHRRCDQHDDHALDRPPARAHAAVRPARLARGGGARAHHTRLPRAHHAEAAARRAGARAAGPLEPGDPVLRGGGDAVPGRPPCDRALPPERRLRERLRADRDDLHAHHPRPRGPSPPGDAGGDRGAAAVPPRGRGSGGDRRARPRVGPARGGLRRRPPGGVADRRGARRLLPPAARDLQEARGDPLRRRAAEEPDGQDPPARPARAARPRVSPARGPSRARRPPSRHPRPASRPAVELAVRDGVAWMTLARPASGNRLDAELLGALVEGSAAAEDDDGVRVVVLAAEGPAFSLGLPRACRWPERSWPDGVGALGGLTKPVIAAIQGAAVGWGLALALACDLRTAPTAAVLALPELGERRFPGGGVTQRLPRIIGTARAMELVLLGTRLPAATAAAWGLVSAAVAPARLASTVEETARGRPAPRTRPPPLAEGALAPGPHRP